MDDIKNLLLEFSFWRTHKCRQKVKYLTPELPDTIYLRIPQEDELLQMIYAWYSGKTILRCILCIMAVNCSGAVILIEIEIGK